MSIVYSFKLKGFSKVEAELDDIEPCTFDVFNLAEANISLPAFLDGGLAKSAAIHEEKELGKGLNGVLIDVNDKGLLELIYNRYEEDKNADLSDIIIQYTCDPTRHFKGKFVSWCLVEKEVAKPKTNPNRLHEFDSLLDYGIF